MTSDELQQLKSTVDDLKYKLDQVFKPDRFLFQRDVELAAGKQLRGLFVGAVHGNDFLPRGWSVSHGGTGSFTITHNLGIADYVVMLTLNTQGTFHDFSISLSGKDANSFTVCIADPGNTLFDVNFYFLLIPR